MRVPSTTYAGGEIGPGLYGRVDLNKYQTGVAFAENFHVAVEGGLYKRWGHYYVGKPKFQNLDTKIVRWQIAPDDSYILEFGHLYIRLVRLGGYVQWPGHTPLPGAAETNVDGFLEIATPYQSVHVRELKFAFANDIVYIFHKNYQPRELRRISLNDWEFGTRTFNPEESAPTGLTVVHEVAQSDGTWGTKADPGSPVDNDNYLPAPKNIQYAISATMADGSETLASPIVTKLSDLGYHRLRNHISWNAKTGAQQYTIYKGQNGILGFIGYVSPSSLVYIDNNIAPSFDVVPVKPFTGFGSAQHPRVGEFYKQRMAYGATEKEPQKLWFSRPGFFTTLSTSIPSQNDDAIEVQLVGNSRHTINHMIQLKKFIVFTDTAEWVIQTAANEALAPGSIDPVPETAYGSDPFLSPMAIGDRILFIQNISGAVRDMGYEFTTNAYDADDLSRLSRHLFENKRVVAWDYADFPHNAIWTVCDDGSLPTMTYVREHEIWGWTHMVTQGEYLDVASVSEINQHASYFLIRRQIAGNWVTTLERSETIFSDRIEDHFYVDCGLTYSEPRAVSNLAAAGGELTFTVTPHTLDPGEEVEIETPLWHLRCRVTAVAGNNITVVPRYSRPVPDEVPTAATVYLCANHLTGFEHLAGHEGCVALADGKVIKDLTVSSSGEVNLPYHAARVHLGLPYSAEMRTLSLDTQQAVGQFIERTVDDIYIHLKDSRGVLVGSAQTDRELYRIPGRSIEDMDEANATLDGVYQVPSHVGWDNTAAVIVRSEEPLPCHILNIVPDLQYGN